MICGKFATKTRFFKEVYARNGSVLWRSDGWMEEASFPPIKNNEQRCRFANTGKRLFFHLTVYPVERSFSP